MMPIFETENLVKCYGQVTAVAGVDLTIQPGERLGIVGESGSGKSTLTRLLAGLSRPSSGEIKFNGESIVGKSERQLGFLRAQVQVVFQDPLSSLDPRMKVGKIVTESLRSPWVGRMSRKNIKERCAEVLTQVGLDPKDADKYPHQFSGGQRQRIAIARALAPNPNVLIADEAVSALDVSVRAQVMNLLGEICDQKGLTLLFVSHDLTVVRHLCQRTIVMYQGKIIEEGPSEKVLHEPSQEYTKQLVAAIPKLEWL